MTSLRILTGCASLDKAALPGEAQAASPMLRPAAAFRGAVDEIPCPQRPPAPCSQPEPVPAPQIAPAECIPAAGLPPVTAEPPGRLIPSLWAELPGWQGDDLQHTWSAFLNSCSQLRTEQAWQAVCDRAIASGSNPDRTAALQFFEDHFTPYQVINADGSDTGVITGYYEPLLYGSRVPTARFRYPLYTVPSDLLIVDLSEVYPELKSRRLRGRLDGNRVVPYLARADIEREDLRPLHGKELAWVDDPVELFFLQIQGSGRIQLEDGAIMHVGYADQNGHPFHSVGRLLIQQGELTPDRLSMQGIKAWARVNPDKLNAFLNANPSYVFFKELPGTLSGPLGTLGVPLTAERSIAIDSRVIPLGAPVYLSTRWPNSSTPLNVLVMAQDTGGAISGAVRADFFWGFGDTAGRFAGAMKQIGRMWVLLPHGYPIKR